MSKWCKAEFLQICSYEETHIYILDNLRVSKLLSYCLFWVNYSFKYVLDSESENTCVTLEHKTSHKSHEYICSNSQQYIVSIKIIDFSLCQKSLGY